MDEKIKVIAIGDPHFKEKYLNVMEKFVDYVLEIVKKENPEFVVVLGDLLDTMNIVRTQSHKLAVKFLKSLGKLTTTYLIIGNHDLINNSQFLTDNHIFTPFHGVEEKTGVYVIDRPKVFEHYGLKFGFCPYVPPGRFMEALNTLGNKGECTLSILDVECIFAHQEFKGAKMGAIISEEGDVWEDPTYPPVISGHIHDSQILGDKVYYTGSAIQHSFSENEKKGLWSLTFEKGKPFTYTLIPNFFKTKRTLTMTVKEAREYKPTLDVGEDNPEETRICIVDDTSNLQSFYKTKEQQRLENQGIKIITRNSMKDRENLIKGHGTFWEIFTNLTSERRESEETAKKYEIYE